MKCRVIKLAFHNGERLKPGRIVEITTRKIPGWCERISVAAEEVESPAVAPKAKRASKRAPAAAEGEAPKNEIEGAGQDLV